jgi:hypothetical protein
MRAVGHRLQALQAGELQSDATKAFDNVLRSAVRDRGVGAAGDGLPPSPLATLRCSLLSYGWERHAAIGNRSFRWGSFLRGITHGSGGARSEMKLAVAAHLARILAAARHRARHDVTSHPLQVQVDDFSVSVAGPSQGCCPFRRARALGRHRCCALARCGSCFLAKQALRDGF